MKKKLPMAILQGPVASWEGVRAVYTKTNEVVCPAPLRRLSGRAGEELVFIRRNDRCFVRPYRLPDDPETDVQLVRRAALGLAARQWQTLSGEARDQWRAFAAANRINGKQLRGPAAGYMAYSGAQLYRQGMGLAASVGAVIGPVPARVVRVELAPVRETGVLRIAVRHAARELSGLRLLVELTPAMPTIRRQPRLQELRWFAVRDADSFLPLQKSGAVYELAGAKFEIKPGRSHGVRVRIVNEQGIASEPVFGTILV